MCLLEYSLCGCDVFAKSDYVLSVPWMPTVNIPFSHQHFFESKIPRNAYLHYFPFILIYCNSPYPEPVYTGWSSVLWNATGMPLVDPVYTGMPLEKLSWNSPTLECHLRNLVEFAPHWDATGETLTFAANTGTPLEGLWQPTHAPTHIVKHAE